MKLDVLRFKKDIEAKYIKVSELHVEVSNVDALKAKQADSEINTIGKYLNVGSGNSVKDAGKWCLMVGALNSVSANTGFAGGARCVVAKGSSGAIAYGESLVTARYAQAVFGQCNSPNERALFQIGNGVWKNNQAETRSNAFEILDDGNAYLFGKRILTEGAEVSEIYETLLTKEW